MKVILQDNKNLLTTKLPLEVNGNYWLTDSNNKNLVNIEAIDNKWILKSNNDINIIDNNNQDNSVIENKVDYVELTDFSNGTIWDINNGIEYKYYCMPFYDYTMTQVEINRMTLSNISIGKSTSSTIVINNNSFLDKQIEIINENNQLKIINYNLNIPMYINDRLVVTKELNPGDYVFIAGFYFCIYGSILVFNNPNNSVKFDKVKLRERNIPVNEDIDYSQMNEHNLTLYTKKDFFQRTPRFKKIIEPKEFSIDPPTQKQTSEEMPMILTIGPMMVMGMTSMISGITAIISIKSGQKTVKECLTTLIMSGSMLMGMIVFPIIQKYYMKFRRWKKEKKRIKKYNEYIEKKRTEISKELALQKQILLETYLSLDEIQKTILEKRRNLWEKKIDHYDFLTIRLGLGKLKSFVTVSFPEERFTVEEDELRNLGEKLKDNTEYLVDVPISLSLVEKRNTSFIGNAIYLKRYFDGIFLQLMCNTSYDFLKIVVLTDKANSDYWDKYKNIPHFWSDNKSIRFIGYSREEIDYISSYLTEVYNSRIDLLEDNKDNERIYTKFKPYYLIVTDEITKVKNSSFVNTILSSNINLGFSVVAITETIDELPNEFNTFVNIEPTVSNLFEDELVSTNKVEFVPEIPTGDLSKCYVNLCNIPVDIDEGKFALPTKYSFLEMFDVGNVNQLNIINRWKESNPTQSLSTCVGINEQGELFNIDLHETAHGPHGLVAGMTGSGKSEWIITYVLSMCINYHPYEVQFVLIDYKGGGLAGTFENKETGFKLPHLAGTITNLDIAEINRSLASINSELKRRQAKFNEARDKLGESSIDIYKYQRFYREGKIDEPISHLFIISDEFAELKAQQPEFMQQLISTARIGRSLGVHLILATQKPSGVVDDQIWSNSKFRVCLKVQDKADSNDMIRVPDAAFLKEAGRFYLQVGYNEYFAKGQSAYAGSPYYESEKHKTIIDSDLEFINNVGQTYKEINTERKVVDAVYKGEELPFILKTIDEAAKEENISVKQLWLDAIPEKIYIPNLVEKYGYKKENFILNPIIGEYDAPAYQKQGLLTLPISKNGNTLIYGMANSGKENLLTTILYSLMTYHVADEVNVYVIDCGAEVLNSFRTSPIIGDIMNSSESEMIKNLFKKLNEELEKRKDLLKDYNGDYYYYVTHQENIIPNILCIINNYDAFQEIYSEEYYETLIKLTREGEKLGISFIMTAVASNSLRFKLSQNFKQVILLQMTEETDYKSLLNNPNKVIPSKLKGRGIIDVGEVYEFQTAYPSNQENIQEYIKQVSDMLKTKAKSFAEKIPTLPNIVSYEFISNEVTNIDNVPIGVNVDNLKIMKYNFMNKGFLITCNDTDIVSSFTNILYKIIDNINDPNLARVIINSNKEELPTFNKIKIFDERLDDIFKQYYDYIKKEQNKRHLLIINGIHFLNDPKFDKILDDIAELKRSNSNINVILIDSIDEIKKIKIKLWFNNLIDTKTGIWLGSGIQNQTLLEINNSYDRKLREEIPFYEGYYINKGNCIKIKLLQSKKEI